MLELLHTEPQRKQGKNGMERETGRITWTKLNDLK